MIVYVLIALVLPHKQNMLYRSKDYCHITQIINYGKLHYVLICINLTTHTLVKQHNNLVIIYEYSHYN